MTKPTIIAKQGRPVGEATSALSALQRRQEYAASKGLPTISRRDYMNAKNQEANRKAMK